MLKTLITGFGCIVLLFWSIVIQGTIINHSIRANELNTAINNAFIDTQRVISEDKYQIASSEEYISEFTQNLLQYVDSNSDISIKVYSANEKTGLLDIEVIETYSYKDFTNGTLKTRQYKTRRTSIIDELTHYDSNQQDSYLVRFDIDEHIELDLIGDDENSFVSFKIPKNEDEYQLKLHILSGDINTVNFLGCQGNYEITTIDNNKYLIMNVSHIVQDITISIQ